MVSESRPAQARALCADERHVPERFRHIPEPVRLEDTIASQPSEFPHDPDGGRNPETDFMLRFGSG